MQRRIFTEDHEAFRKTIRDFIAKEVAPVYHDWEKQGHPPREFYNRLGDLGVLGIEAPEEFGGGGVSDFTYSLVIAEETSAAGVTFGSYSVHSNLILPYLMEYGTQEQKERWIPGFCSGETMFAIAMTEPGTGSDLANIATTAKLSEDGSHYVLDGAKTFITGGALADRILVVARTTPFDPPENRRAGLSILVVDTKSEGFAVGRKIDKIGLKASDTAELSFSSVKVPVEDLLGEEGAGFKYLSHNLAQERLTIAIGRRPPPRQPSSTRSPTPRSVTSSAGRWPRSRTPSSCSPSAPPRSRRSAPSSTVHSNCTTRANSPSRMRRAPSCSRPRPRARSSTSACNCTAVTATSSSTRSPACTPTPVSRASTAAPARS